MTDVDALIAQAREALQATPPVEQEVLIGKSLAVVQFRLLESDDWQNLVATKPPRQGSPRDVEFGYNIDAVTAGYPKVIVFIDGEQLNLWTIDDEGKSAWRWPDIVSALSGPDRTKLAFAVWGLNVWDPQQATAAAGKVSAGARRKKRSSPANSESPSANSTGGRQRP